MTSFPEYAALARHLHELHRAEERTAAQSAEYRGATGAAIQQLGQRLVLQYQRLVALGRAIGRPFPAPPGSGPLPPDANPPPGSGPPGGVVPAQYPPSGPPSVPGQHPGGQGGWPGPPGHGAQPGQGVPPGQPPGRGHPELPPGPARRALPTSAATDQGGWPVPGQRRPPSDPAASPVSGVAPTPPGSGAGGVPGSDAGVTSGPADDPRRELELARQAADGADAALHQVETLAQRPPLLPTLSPLARAVAVYAACAGAVAVIHWALLLTSGFDSLSGIGRGETFSLFAWSCAGMPTVAFFVGYFVLTVWGKPRLLVGTPPRYARLGFLICFVATPLAFCLYTFARA